MIVNGLGLGVVLDFERRDHGLFVELLDLLLTLDHGVSLDLFQRHWFVKRVGILHFYLQLFQVYLHLYAMLLVNLIQIFGFYVLKNGLDEQLAILFIRNRHDFVMILVKFVFKRRQLWLLQLNR